MGILRALRLVDDVTRPAPTAAAAAFPSPLTSLPTDVAAAFGISAGTIETVTRAEAMSVPAVRRGRSIIAGSIGALPLRATRGRAGGGLEVVERALLAQPNPDVTRAHVVTWTIDDMLFYGRSWWRVLDVDGDGYPVSVERVMPERVRVDIHRDVTGSRPVDVGLVYVDGEHVPDNRLIRFDGPDEGLLAYGGRVLRTAILLEQAVRRNSDGLPPQDLLALAEGARELSTVEGSADPDDPAENRSEVEALLDEWQYARRTRGTAYINRAIEHRVVGFDPRAMQLAEARQHQALEIARMLNLSADDVDAPGGTGMTYQNREARQRDRVDNTLRPYLAAFTGRLTMGDVTPRGWVVDLDLSDYLRTDTAAAIKAGAEAVGAGLMDTDEVRANLLGLPPASSAPSSTPPERTDPA